MKKEIEKIKSKFKEDISEINFAFLNDLELYSYNFFRNLKDVKGYLLSKKYFEDIYRSLKKQKFKPLKERFFEIHLLFDYLNFLEENNIPEKITYSIFSDYIVDKITGYRVSWE